MGYSKQKTIPKAGRGVYDLAPTVQAYIHYLQGLCCGAIKSGEPSELDKRLLEAKVLERESKARQAKYRADRMEQELKLDRYTKNLLKVPDKVAAEIVKLYQLDEGSELRIKSEIADAIARALMDGYEN